MDPFQVLTEEELGRLTPDKRRDYIRRAMEVMEALKEQLRYRAEDAERE